MRPVSAAVSQNAAETGLDTRRKCSTFVLMMHGQSLSANLPDDAGLGDRFWYWRGASGERYIHTIYRADLCPPVSGAVFVRVRSCGGRRQALSVGRFGPDGALPMGLEQGEDEIHVHLLARGEDAAERVMRDLEYAMGPPVRSAPRVGPDARGYTKPVQLELLAA